ncbi:hypothetical protein L1987_78342 [Smallanthus sonchifolius]|uniref:Uncharacterized protein n=1 Tax=Smallanthus sonchifolius TaxID=185202 RepID=A0ACB8ZC60_9ASTR|nr:hypothetical protein L1987_78342 [Smallanthus sonchifolius]
MAARAGEGRQWQEVRRKKDGGATGSIYGRSRRGNHRETSFSVSDLPEGTSAKELESCFLSYGEVADAYVAAKRDRALGLFGFVRFYDVKDNREMERMVTLNNAKLSVNLARFGKDGKRTGRPMGSIPHQNIAGPPHQAQVFGVGQVRGRENSSYREVLTRNLAPTMEVSVPEDANFDAVQWYDKSVLGKMNDFKKLCCFHQATNGISEKISKVRYVGGLQVIITFKKETEAIAFVSDKESWAAWFSSLEIWKGQSYAYERIVWLRIFGVHAHLWEAQVFDSTASKVGPVIAPSKAEFADKVLTYDTVGSLAGESWVGQKEVVLKW